MVYSLWLIAGELKKKTESRKDNRRNVDIRGLGKCKYHLDKKTKME